MLAQPCLCAHQQSRHHAGPAVQAALVCRLLPAAGQRMAFRVSVQIHVAPQGVAHQAAAMIVAVRAVLPESGDGCHDQAGIFLLQRRIVQAQAGEMAGRKVLHHDVRPGSQPF